MAKCREIMQRCVVEQSTSLHFHFISFQRHCCYAHGIYDARSDDENISSHEH